MEFACKRVLTKEDLRQAAKELGMPVEEVELMYERACGFGLKETSFKSLGDVFKTLKKDEEEQVSVDDNGYVRKKPKIKKKSMLAGASTTSRSNALTKVTRTDHPLDPMKVEPRELVPTEIEPQEVPPKTVEQIVADRNKLKEHQMAIAFMNLPAYAQKLAWDGMTEQQKKELEAAVVNYAGAIPPTEPKLEGFTINGFRIKEDNSDAISREVNQLFSQVRHKGDNFVSRGEIATRLKAIQDILDPQKQKQAFHSQFTSQALNQEAGLIQAYKEGGQRYPKRVTSPYDAFTSQQLNQGNIQVTTKEETAELEKWLDGLRAVFASKELGEPQVDNRAKVGNVYDAFTSVELNRGFQNPSLTRLKEGQKPMLTPRRMA
jgi:hypothetical protein